MLNIRKILVPVVFGESSTGASSNIADQAAWLARRFQSEIILLHVVTPLSYPAGMFESGDGVTAQDLHARVVQKAEAELDRALWPELEGITVTRMLLRGHPGTEIVRTAREQNADLIVMATHGEAAFVRLLLGSVTGKVLHESPCPVWTGAHIQDAPKSEFSVRNVVCAIDLTPHSRHTASLAVSFAAAAEATLTFVHITAGVEIWGPGGSDVDPAWQKTIVGIAHREAAQLQEEIGTHTEVIVDSGNVSQLLSAAAERTGADVLVIGHRPGRSHLGDNGNGYGIIRASRIPVLSV